MNLSSIVDLLTAMVALAIALSVVGSHPVAATCLIQYTVLIVLKYESETFREIIETHQRTVSLVKIGLLLVAAISLVYGF